MIEELCFDLLETLVAGSRQAFDEAADAADDREPAIPAKWYVSEWRDQSTAAIRRLAELDLSAVKFTLCFKELKPDAITLIEESPNKYKVVILSDGVCDGGPLVFDLPR